VSDPELVGSSSESHPLSSYSNKPSVISPIPQQQFYEPTYSEHDQRPNSVFFGYSSGILVSWNSRLRAATVPRSSGEWLAIAILSLDQTDECV